MYSTNNNQTQKGLVKVKLIQKNPMVLNGDITGRIYEFKNSNDVIWVDNRDAKSMDTIAGLQVIY